MKIAYLSAGGIPSTRANTLQVMKVCQALTQLGHQVTLFAPAADRQPLTWQALASHYGLTARFDVLLSPPSPSRRKISTLSAMLRAKKMGADLIYVRSLPPAVLGLLSGLPVILEMHQLPSGRFGPLWFSLFLRLRGRKRLAPITHALAHALQARYRMKLTPAQLVIAPSGVDLERFADLPSPPEARRRLGLPDQWTAVCTGHLYPGRGMNLVLELARRLPEVQFLWAGGYPPEVESWRGRAREAGVTNLHLPGHLPNQELPLHQAAADALLIPYQPGFTNSGGEDISAVSSPLKIFEYLATGRPICCSDLPVLREVLNETNSRLLPAGDVTAWETALRQLQAHPQSGAALAHQAKSDAHAYTWLERSRRVLAGFLEDTPPEKGAPA